MPCSVRQDSAEFASSAIGASSGLRESRRELPAVTASDESGCNEISLVFTALLLAKDSAMWGCGFSHAKKKTWMMVVVQLLRTSYLERLLRECDVIDKDLCRAAGCWMDCFSARKNSKPPIFIRGLRRARNSAIMRQNPNDNVAERGTTPIESQSLGERPVFSPLHFHFAPPHENKVNEFSGLVLFVC